MNRLKIEQSKDQKVYFFSDPHHSHRNICAGETNWVKLSKSYEEWERDDERGLIKFCLQNGLRPFASVDEMNHTIVNNINDLVKENDVLICLGDWSFGAKENVASFRNSILCKNLHLIYGNHDKHIEDPKNNYQKLFSTVSYYKEFSIDDVMVCCFHYKQYIWNKSHHQAYSLYGHSHSAAEHMEIGRSMDVGMDNAYRLFGEYRPFSFDEITDLLKDRKFTCVDNHSSKENQE